MKFKLVEDSNVSVVYHYTTVEKLLKILDSDTFVPGPWNNLSTTTQSNPVQYSNNILNVLIALEYNKLSKKFKSDVYDSNSGPDGLDSEHEIRFTVSEPIKNFSAYIKSIKLHKTMEDNTVSKLYLQKIGIKSFEQLIIYIKSKISNTIVEGKR